MNKSILYLPLLFLWGCSSLPIQVNWNPQENEPTETAEEGCSEQPSASLSNPEAIAIDNQRVQKSGTLRSGKDVGYTFQGRTGQKLNFALSDDVCIWFYTPSNELMSGVELPQDGTYVVQLGTLKGTTTYDLEIGLQDSGISTNPTTPPPPTPSPTSTYSPPPSSGYSPPPQTQPSGLTSPKAVEVVNGWLSAKSQVFAPPFNTALAGRYATGPLYADLVKSDGPVAWLRNNNSYYRYSDSRVVEVVSFSDSPSLPEVTLRVYEDRTLYNSRGGIDPSNSGSSTGTFSYTFAKDGGTWKIYDYRKVE